MRRATRLVPLLLLVGLVGLLPAKAEPRTGYLLEQHVPASTLAFVSLDRLDTWHARWEETGLGRLMADEEMTAFLEPMMKQMEELAKQGMSEMPPGLVELLEQLHTVRGQIAIALVDADPQTETVKAAMSIDFKDSTDTFVGFLRRMAEQMDPEGRRVKIEMRDGRMTMTVDAGDMALYGTVRDTTMLMATDEAMLTQLMEPAGDALANGGDFQKVRSRCGGEDLAVFAYANVGAALERYEDMMPPEVKGIGGAMGLDTIRSAAYGLAVTGGGFRDTIMVHTPAADHGIVPVVQMAPLTEPRTLAMTPAGAFYWAEANVSFDTLLPGIRALVQGVDPDAVAQIDQFLEMGNQVLQIDVEKDLLGGLAGPYGAYMTFPPAGGLFPELAVMLVAKDPAAMEQTLVKVNQGLAGMLNEQGDVIANVRQMQYHGQTMHLFEMQAARGDDPIPFTPTWTVLGDTVVLTLVPHTMKEILLRAEADWPGANLGSKADFQALLRLKPADAGGMEYVDLQSGMALLYGTLVPLLQTVAKPNVMEGDVPFAIDWAQLPPASRVAQYFGSFAEYVTWNEDGLVITYQGPMPILPFAVGMGAAMFAMRSSMMDFPAMGPGSLEMEEIPMVEEGGLDLEMDLELARLQAEIFADAVQRYVANNGKLPASLDALAEGGYVSSVSKDPWGGVYQFVPRGEEGFQIVSSGPDGEFGTGDDLTLERE